MSMRRGFALLLFATGALNISLASAGGYRRQVIVNGSDTRANDLHLIFKKDPNNPSPAKEVRISPKDQGMGKDANGRRVNDYWWQWWPNDFGTVSHNGRVYVDYKGGLCGIDKENSRFTDDGKSLPGFTLRGGTWQGEHVAYSMPQMTYTNGDAAMEIGSVQLFKDNDVGNYSIDRFFTPTGIPVATSPPSTLDPGQSIQFDFGAVTPGTYVLAIVEMRPAGEPLAEFEPDIFAMLAHQDVVLVYDPSSGVMTMDSADNPLTGFLLHAPEAPFTGTAALPPGYLFYDNDPGVLAAQFPDPNGGPPPGGVWDFGPSAVDPGLMWDPVEGQWAARNWEFEYTIEGVEGTFQGDVIVLWEPGDVDFDGDVDPWDIQRILAANSYENGSGWGWESGDFNGDTQVTWVDIEMILTGGNYDPAMEPALLALVPEPTSLTVFALVGLALLRRRRRNIVNPPSASSESVAGSGKGVDRLPLDIEPVKAPATNPISALSTSLSPSKSPVSVTGMMLTLSRPITSKPPIGPEVNSPLIYRYWPERAVGGAAPNRRALKANSV